MEDEGVLNTEQSLRFRLLCGLNGPIEFMIVHLE